MPRDSTRRLCGFWASRMRSTEVGARPFLRSVYHNLTSAGQAQQPAIASLYSLPKNIGALRAPTLFLMDFGSWNGLESKDISSWRKGQQTLPRSKHTGYWLSVFLEH